MVARGHPAGTNFIVCFSSRFDACSGAIRGRLVNEDVPASSDSVSDAPATAEPGPSCAAEGRNAVGEDARASSSSSAGVDRIPRVSPRGDRTRHAATPRGKKTVSKVRRGVVSTSSGVRTGGDGGSTSTSSRNRMTHGRCDTTPEARVVALLLDEKPRHRHRGGGGSSSGSGGPAAGRGDDGGEGVRGMRVAEWVDAWGECDGPMLAAWVFPGNDQGVAAARQ